MEEAHETSRQRRTWRRVLALVGLLALVAGVATLIVVSTLSTTDDATADRRSADAASADAASDVARGPDAPATRLPSRGGGRTKSEEERAPGRAGGEARVDDVARKPDARTPPPDADRDARTAVAETSDGSTARKPSASRDGTRTNDVAPERTLVVRVTAAETGAPLSAADVRVFLAEGAPRSTRSDFAGKAVFAVPAAATVDVEAKAAGRVRLRRDGAAPSPDKPLEMALERGVVVRGRITGSKAARAAATVRAFVLEPWLKVPPYDPDPRPVETTTSDKKGAYRLDCIPRGVACALVVEADGCAASVDEIEPQPDPAYVVRRDEELEAGAAIEGVVRDKEGKPVEGAWALAFDDEMTDIGQSFWNGVGLDEGQRVELALLDALRDGREDSGLRPPRVRTGSDGRYRIVVPRSWDGVRTIAMHPSAGRSRPSPRNPPGAADATLVVRGRVRAEYEVRASDGRPAVGASIAPYFPWERWSVSERSPGVYGFADIDDGPSVDRVSGVADAPGVYVGRRIDVNRVRWRVDLKSGVTLSGLVRDDRGTAVVGATVTCGDRAATTGAAGRFELVGARADDGLVMATAQGHDRGAENVGRGAHSGIVIVLARAASARLRLQLPKPAPEPPWRRVWRGSATPRDWGGGGKFDDQFAWRDGVVELSNLSARDDLMVVFVPGYEVVVRAATIKPGEATDLGDASLVRARRMRGVVVDEHGQAVPDAEVLVQVAGTAPWRGMLPDRSVDADKRGEFEVEVVAPQEKCEIVVSAPGFPPTPQAFDPRAEAPLRVVLGSERTFHGRALELDDEGWNARVLGPNHEVYALVPIAKDGTFEAETPLPPRGVEIVQAWRDYPPVRRAVVPSDWPETAVFDVPK